MSSPPRPLSDHRRARLQAWAGLWLFRLAACLAHVTPQLLPPLDPIRRLILALLVIRATDFAPPARSRINRNSAPQRKIRVRISRALLGARTRGMLRARTLGERITLLLNLLRDFDAHAARIARRLTRLRPVLTARQAAEALACGAGVAAVAFDTS